MVSSRLLEFVVALVVGILAITGALFCVGFLLIHPLRTPPSDSSISTSTALNSAGCPLDVVETSLPSHCSWNGSGSIPLSRCSLSTCTCTDQLAIPTTCCCRSITQKPVMSVDCGGTERLTPLIFNTTDCGCRACDDIEVVISLTVVTGSARDPVIAAQVYSVDRVGDRRLLGITGNKGQFSYRVQVEMGSMMLSVQAPGYMRHNTNRIRLLPNVPVVTREIGLIRTTRMTFDNTDTLTSIPLNPFTSISVLPNGFMTPDGEPYTGTVVYEGIFLDTDSSDFITAVPKPSFEYRDSNGTVRHFGVLYGFMGSFSDVDGEKLNVTSGVRVSLVIEDTQDVDIFILNFQDNDDMYEPVGNITRIQSSRKKRQTETVQQLDATGIDLTTFNLVAVQLFIGCYVQVRTFTDTGADLDGVTVVLSQLATVNNNLFQFIFTVETGGLQSTTSRDNLNINSVCIPLACSNFDNAEITATMSGSLVPVAPLSSLFNGSVNSPMVLTTVFVFGELFLATPTTSFPFYSNVDSCRSQGQETSAGLNSSDYLSFEDIPLEIPTANSGRCFAKVIVRDCFPFSRITTRSITTGNETQLEVGTFSEVLATTTASGDFPTDAATEAATEVVTEAPTDGMPDFVAPTTCNASTATLRVGCIQYDCGFDLQLTAQSDQPNLPLGTFGMECSLFRFAPLLGSASLSSTSPQELQIQADVLLESDFNNPSLGLYHETGNTNEATEAAEELCNAGGSPGSMDIDPTVGVTAEFTCFF